MLSLVQKKGGGWDASSGTGFMSSLKGFFTFPHPAEARTQHHPTFLKGGNISGAIHTTNLVLWTEYFSKHTPPYLT